MEVLPGPAIVRPPTQPSKQIPVITVHTLSGSTNSSRPVQEESTLLKKPVLVKPLTPRTITANSDAHQDIHKSEISESWFKTVEKEALTRAEDEIKKLGLTTKEKATIDEIKGYDIEDYDSFLASVKKLVTTHYDKKDASVRGKAENGIASFNSFAESYSGILHLLCSAGPFGGGAVVLGLCAVVSTAISNKVQRENNIQSFLGRISDTVPRLKEYGIIYPENKQLAVRQSIKGSILRFFKAMSPNDKIEPLIGDIQAVSLSICDEGMKELCAKVNRVVEYSEATLGETRAIREQLKSTNNELHVRNDELRATQELLSATREELAGTNIKLGVATNQLMESATTDIKRNLDSIKKNFVPESYDPDKIYRHSLEQIRMSSPAERRKFEYGRAMEHASIARWLSLNRETVASPCEMIWLTPKTPGDNTISYMTVGIIDQLIENGASLPSLSWNGLLNGLDITAKPLIIYSLYQVGQATTSIENNTRTASTLLQEAIFQLILHDPRLIQHNEKLQLLCRKRQGVNSDSEEISHFQELLKILRDMVNPPVGPACDGGTDSSGLLGSPAPRPIFWVIDQIDEVSWIPTGAPRKRGVKLPQGSATHLSTFASAIERLVYPGGNHHRLRTNRRKSCPQPRIPTEDSRLRILITSSCIPDRLDSDWAKSPSDFADDEDIGYETFDQGLSDGCRPGWVELSALPHSFVFSMPPTVCFNCHTARAVIIRPKNRHKLCKSCFLLIFEEETHDTIVSNELFYPGERVAIGASGGKDSTVLASILKTLNERYNYGLDLVLLSIDEGIKGYRDDSLETVKRNSLQYEMPLEIVSYAELYGWTMDQVVAEIGKKGNCTYCGVFRRQALDRGAGKLKIKHVVTGHNADDVAETVMMNLLRGDLPRLARGTSILTGSAISDIKRSKPLKYAYEKEIVLYAHHKKLDYFTTECIYSPEAFRGSARTLIKDLERIRPSTILDIVRSGEDMAKLVPPEVCGVSKNCLSANTITADANEDYASGGCGSQNGRTGGDDMAEMERSLADNEDAGSREIEISLPPLPTKSSNHSNPSPSSQPNPSRGRKGKAVKTQTMGQCEQCGYMSSQKICKACTLLEGLNKSRPKTTVEFLVGDEEEESSSTLMRQMEKIELSGG
ncbi:nucleotidyltransferase [Myotisia sp. PD_48]|nr:nucleotidyltransferase [Myotisia sp. PD_48]